MHIETWQAAYRGLLASDYLDGLGAELEQRGVWWDRQIADAEPHRWTQLVAEDVSGIAGFVTCGPSEGEDADPTTGEVYAIYVHPRAWSHGLGRELLARAIESLRAQGFRDAVLWMLEGNERARRFYERAGWRTDGGVKTDRRGALEFREVRYRAALEA